jgi:hypothetical protein
MAHFPPFSVASEEITESRSTASNSTLLSKFSFNQKRNPPQNPQNPIKNLNNNKNQVNLLP